MAKVNKPLIFAFAVVLIAQIGVMAYWGARKQGAHQDEINTFYQTNGEELWRMYEANDFSNNWQPTSAFRDGITLKAQNRFDFITTYKKSKLDTSHPPLYYLTYHFAASFFPDQLSFWPGIGLNMLYFIGCSLFLTQISRLLIKDGWMSLIPCVFWGFSAAAVNSVTFIRMYMMMTLMCLGFTYFITRLIISGFSARWLAGAATFTLLGTLTQYYFMIYALFLSAFYFFLLFRRREIKKTIMFSVAMALALCASVLCYPKIIKNIFSDQRGIEAIKNAVNNAAFPESVRAYLKIISDLLFNSHMIVILGAISLTATALVLIRCGIIKKRGKATFINALKGIFRPDGEVSSRLFVWCSYAVTNIAFTIVIARVAPFVSERYILCAMPMLVLTLTAALECIRVRLHINRAAYAAVALGLTVVLCCASMPGQLDHLYRFSSGHYKMIDDYNELPIIVVLQREYIHRLSKIHMEIMEHDTKVYVTTSDQLNMLESESNIMYTNDGAIVYVSKDLDQKKAIKTTARATRLPHSEKLFYQNGFHTYRLYN